jgi:glycolate oxidase iron-sulfur subunit
MQTRLPAALAVTPVGQEADQILRRCVHCGFCNATCPTFRLTGNELEGPRGRIYLIKDVLEGETPTRRTVGHLDRCLGCRACETTCPSGVNYHRLADIGREALADRNLRPWWDRWRRKFAARFFDGSRMLKASVAVGRSVRWLLPPSLARQLSRSGPAEWPVPKEETDHQVMLHEGCVQPILAPTINAAAARVLGRRGIGSRRAEGCCGALAYHLDDIDRAKAQIRRNIDAWWPDLEQSKGMVVTASGCAAFLKDYGHICRDDPAYAERARELADRVSDVSEFVEPLPRQAGTGKLKFALHIPCTLKNALGGEARLRKLLNDSGWQIVPTADDGQCCGSAGAYSLLHRQTAGKLRDTRLEVLESGSPECILTANIGCMSHLAGATAIPVRHWIEAWDEAEE